jgi:DNA-directed RNA polymerase specialized sigma24 family protein
MNSASKPVPRFVRSRTLIVNARDRARLEGWIRARTAPQRTVLRSRVVLLLAEGFSAREAARRLGVSRHTVDLWRARYLQEGCDALTRDRPGRGRRRSDDAADCRIAHPPNTGDGGDVSASHTSSPIDRWS